MVILHNKTDKISTYLVTLTIFLHYVHNLFIFTEYIITIETREGSDYKSHIDKFFHNSPGAVMYLGTPHFMGYDLFGDI